MDLAFDFHGRVHLPMARVLLKELEPLRPIFVEDAVVSDMVKSMADLASVRSCSSRMILSSPPQRPLNTGSRLSPKAAMPSRASSVIMHCV
jgi:hypothetical protein